jgi:hypothetical protein
MKGKVITGEEVKARWAYAEVNSKRFGHTYQANLPVDVYASATEGIPFDGIQSSAWPALVSALKVARNPDFINNIDTCGAPNYQCVEWQACDLLHCQTLPVFGQVPYFQFLARPPNPDHTDPAKPDHTDPRYLSQQFPFDQGFQLREPLIAILVRDRQMLIEGYLRSILWLRNPSYPLLMWVPKP